MNPVVHFEMPGEDMERMKKFYQAAFGWQTEQMGPEMGNYIVVQTDETDDKGMLKKSNRINGGFYKKTADPLSQHPSVVIAVEDIQEAMERVKASGGKVLGGMGQKEEPDDIPGVGLYVSILDTEGNRVGMLEPSERV